jgi:hypothetical protein
MIHEFQVYVSENCYRLSYVTTMSRRNEVKVIGPMSRRNEVKVIGPFTLAEMRSCGHGFKS